MVEFNWYGLAGILDTSMKGTVTCLTVDECESEEEKIMYTENK